jgi:hypothetical protein
MHVEDDKHSLDSEGVNPYSSFQRIHGCLLHPKEHIMSAITSGTYGLQPGFSGGLRQLVGALFSSTRPAVRRAAAAAAPVVARAATSFRLRAREANDVRELARSVELHSPGFAADLYAAAARHEGYDD